MKKTLLVVALLAAVLASPAISQTRILGPGLNTGRTVYHQDKDITLYSDTVYTLTGLFLIDSNVTMTIQPGTLIKGDTASTLVVSRGGKLIANGTQDRPIVFTSNQPAGSRGRGDWGGVVILGEAPTNQVNPQIEGGIVPGSYGGNKPNDNSGILRYVRIEFPGYRFQLDNEINGLTMGGVGRGTTIEYVQVSYSFDDGFEFFGGTVDAKHLINYSGTDDDFDTDFGYSGRIQYAFGLKNPDIWDLAGQTNGFESDNEGSASYDIPRTQPKFSNITLVGPRRVAGITLPSPDAQGRHQYAVISRRGTQQSIHNSVLVGFQGGYSIRDPQTKTAAQGDTLQARNISLAVDDSASGTIFPVVHSSGADPAGFTASTWFNTASYNNDGGTGVRAPSAVGLNNMSSLTAPDPRPTPGSEPLTAGTLFTGTNLDLGYFDSTSYRGAFDVSTVGNQWAAGWSNFDPQNTSYTAGIAAPEVVMGPGLGTGRTVYHQDWDRVLSSDTTYILTGLYLIDSTYSISIEPGTVIKGDTAATLVVSRGGKIFAQGTPEQPIIMAGRKAPGLRGRGDWGGVVILGEAPTNQVNPQIEGGIVPGSYGGSNPNDNSGIVKYVRIEFPGYRFHLDNEINGLTMGGIGAGTTIENVQVSYSFDDGFEFFGGTVNARNIINFGGTDDEFDTDFGFSGNIQFAFGLKDPNVWDLAGQTNGFESDNEGSASYDVPRTKPKFSNITLVGPRRVAGITLPNPDAQARHQYAVVSRRGTQQSIHNSVLVGFQGGYSIRDPQTKTAAQGDTLQARNISLAVNDSASGTVFPVVHSSGADPAGFTASTWFNTASYNNDGGTGVRVPSAVGLVDMSNLNNPDPRPGIASEPATAGTDFSASTNLSAAFFQSTSYRGAFDPAKSMDEQWTAKWAQFDPQNYLICNSTPNATISNVRGGWNLVSLPRDAYNKDVRTVWPNGGSVFSFTGAGYSAVDFATPGLGYWTFYSSDDEVQVTGDCVESAQITVPGAQWVLVGGLCRAIPTSNVTSSGPGSISGSFFRYTGSGYEAVTVLQPFEAYWVFVTGSTTLTIAQ
ncbi:MAG: hypothetical protein CL946_00195 [Ectothiorhodospiraceae bacterium]|nr:hypothetical protein [Ectothiorhodospiraceae bacterium]